MLRADLLVETGTHAVLAATTDPYVAAAVLVVFGVHTVVWGTVLVCASAWCRTAWAGVSAGTLLGGLLAAATSLTVPFWVAAAGMVGSAASPADRR